MHDELLEALRLAQREGVLGDLVAEAKKEPERERTPVERLCAGLRDSHRLEPVLLADVIEDLDRRAGGE